MYHNSGIRAQLPAIRLTKSQDEMIRKDLTELGSVVRKFANKNDGLEQAVRTLEHRQESTEKTLRNLDKKYESMISMMARMMAKLNDKGKDMESRRLVIGPKEGYTK